MRGYVVYGWQEDKPGVFIDMECLNNELEVYWIEEIKSYGFSPVYGIECQVEPITGTIFIDTESKDCVKKAFERYTQSMCDKVIDLDHVQENKRKTKTVKNKTIKKNQLGYFVCVSGDIEICDEPYSI